MSNVHGWTALAGAVVALAGGATTAQAAQRPQQKQQPKPALAVGTSADGSWRLEGRTLTVRLARPLFARSRDRRVHVIVRCGDGVFEAAESIAEGRSFFARAAAANGWFAPTARTLRLRLAADVANAATYCKLEDWQDYGDVPTRGAWMRSLRGSAPRCVRLRGERVVHLSPTALVLGRKADSSSVEEGEVLRACLKPNGRSVGIAEDWEGGGGAGGSVSNGGYVSAGRWLAWRGSWTYHAPGAGGGGTMLLRDLGVAGRPSATVSFAVTAFHGLTAQGTVVFTRSAGEESALLAGLPDGRTVELDRAAAGGQIDQVILSSDGTTVSWRNGATIRAAAVPAGAQSARPDVSTGGDGAGTSFRLEGSRLTLTLPARAVARTARRATVVCGNALGTPVRSDNPASTLYAARIEPELTVPAGARTVSTAVGVDVARWVSDCTLHWNADGRPWMEPTARMRLRRGTAPGCELPPGARVVTDSERTLVVVAGPVWPDGSSYERYSGCDKPAGAWRLLEERGAAGATARR